MSRNIYLYGATKGQINNFDSISIDVADRIINHSADLIYCESINELSVDHIPDVIHSILNKIRVGGNAVFKFINAKIIAKAYYDNSLSDDDMVIFFAENKSIMSIDKINSLINDDFIVSRIEYQDYHILVTITRINLA